MHILLFNEYYPPDTSATAKMAALVAETLAKKHQVTVVAGRPSYDPDEYYPFAFLRTDKRNNVTCRARRLHSIPAPQNEAPCFELFVVSRSRCSARAFHPPRCRSGDDRPSRRRNRRSFHRAHDRPPVRIQHSRYVSRHGRRRRHCAPKMIRSSMGTDASQRPAARLPESSSLVTTCANASSPKAHLRIVS